MADEPVEKVEVTEVEEETTSGPTKKAAPEPKKPKSGKTSTKARQQDASDTWPVSKHVYYAETLYNRPAWLVKHVLRDHEDTEELSTAKVTKELDKYLKTRIKEA